MARRSYTDAEKAKVYVRLVTNEFNVRRTAREMGLPPATVKLWKLAWEDDGPPARIADYVPEIVDEFVMKSEEVIDMGLAKAKELIPELGPQQFSALGTMIGILSDKVTRAKGLPTNKTEFVQRLPDPVEFERALAQYASQMRDNQISRSAEVLDVEIIREQPDGLPQPKE